MLAEDGKWGCKYLNWIRGSTVVNNASTSFSPAKHSNSLSVAINMLPIITSCMALLVGYTSGLAVGHAARTAEPLPVTPIITTTPSPKAFVQKRQQGSVNAVDCTLTSEAATTFLNTYIGNEATTTVTQTVTVPGGLICSCASDVIAGVFTEYNQVGNAILYCATGGPPPLDIPTQPIATVAPSGDPGSPLNKDVSRHDVW